MGSHLARTWRELRAGQFDYAYPDRSRRGRRRVPCAATNVPGRRRDDLVRARLSAVRAGAIRLHLGGTQMCYVLRFVAIEQNRAEGIRARIAKSSYGEEGAFRTGVETILDGRGS